MRVFEKTKIGKLELKNRIIRSATYEASSDENGFPTKDYEKMYMNLAKNEVGSIITGFAYISKEGRAMHEKQSGMDNINKINHYKKITKKIHKYDTKIFLQIAHTGRQTLRKITKQDVVGVSNKKSFYFNGKPKILKEKQIEEIINKFAESSFYAKQSGFDGVQLHAAHGYLIHQFILPSINNRKDIYGIDKKIKIGTIFLERIIDAVRIKCGNDFPVIIKISGSDDYLKKFSKNQFINLIKFLNDKKINAIEISYGTMDYALNIMRGELPVKLILKINPRFKTGNNKIKNFLHNNFLIPLIKLKIKKYSPMYNLGYAKIAKKYTDIPIITVGGIRNASQIQNIIEKDSIDFVSLCRPFICENDFVKKIKIDPGYISKCDNCNYCTIMCDSGKPTTCCKNSSLLQKLLV